MPSQAENTPEHEPAIDAKVALLRRPDAYPDPTDRVEAVETHMAWVFLTDRLAYKLKKPVRYAYLDFSTVEARRRDCEEEVQLNRRLAPDVYLGLTPLTPESDGRMRLDGDGEPIDWLVRMRRLPRGNMLDQRIVAGRVEEADARNIGAVLAGFYERTDRIGMGPEAYRMRVTGQVEADRRELIDPRFALPGELARGVPDAVLRRIREDPDRLERRAAEGRIVEGHGDLRPEHVCLIEPEPVVIDCIEFNPHFRIVDPVSELAFLALECERLGAGWISRVVLETYAERTGDHPPPGLIRFYKAMHGCLRAKIALWHLHEPDVGEPEKWRNRARQYLQSAAEALSVETERGEL